MVDASAGSGRVERTPTRPDLSDHCVSALRRFHQSGRHRADAAALAGDSQTAFGMANIWRFGTNHTGRFHRLLCHHVDCAGGRIGNWNFPRDLAAGATVVGAPDPWGLVRCAVDCLVDQSGH